MNRPSDNFLVKILAFGFNIRQIKSARTRVDENLNENIISDVLAQYLECKVDDIDSHLALVVSEPVKITGTTSVLVRLPRKDHWTGRYQFKKITCMVAVQPKYDLVINEATKMVLELDELDE